MEQADALNYIPDTAHTSPQQAEVLLESTGLQGREWMLFSCRRPRPHTGHSTVRCPATPSSSPKAPGQIWDHPPTLPLENGCWLQQHSACSKDCGILVSKREEDRMEIIHSSSYTHCEGPEHPASRATRPKHLPSRLAGTSRAKQHSSPPGSLGFATDLRQVCPKHREGGTGGS